MSEPLDWDLLQSFLAVARTGTLTGAARRLGIEHSTLSRRLTLLERGLGAKLFERSQSGYMLTQQGELLLERSESVESAVLSIQSDVGQSGSRVSGSVRIGAPDGFGTSVLAPSFGRLTAAHPNLDIDLVATPRSFSLSRREADIVIGLSRPAHGRLYTRLLTKYELGVYGATSYAERWAELKDVEDLANQPFISYIEDLIFTPELDYIHSIHKDITPHIRSSNLLAQLQATAAGVGLCVLPCFLADTDPRLIRILPESIRLTRSFWMAIHADMIKLARIRVTAEFIVDEVCRAAERFMPRIPHRTPSL